jgi:hypothetical protein
VIAVTATISILAGDDDQADSVYAAIHEALKERGLHATYPELPIVNIMETSREVAR